MSNVIEDLVTERNGLQATVDTLAEESRLLSLSWTGRAADAYAQAQGQMLADGQLRLDELDTAIQGLHEILVNYEQAEATIVALCG